MTITIIFTILLTLGLIAVVAFDASKFIIPNWLNLAFILLYPFFLLTTPVHIEWWLSLAVMVAFFAIGYGIFAANIMGGGDIKLLIALSLWIGWQPQTLVAFIFIMSISGGVLSLFLLSVRLVVKALKKQKAMPRIFRMKSPIPYGIAISYAFGYLLWTHKILGL